MADRLLPTTFKGWAGLCAGAVAVLSTVTGSALGAYAWLLSTIEHVHISLDEIERQREALLADIVLLDKAIARTPEGPDLDELLEARVGKYAELDRLNGLEG
jgi:hypothetical protein